MKIEQIYTGCLAQGAYYIESNGEAAIIDPLREVQPYIDRANKRHASIKYIFETHFHADFVSGHMDLAKKTGAAIVYGPTKMKTGFECIVAEDGQVFKLGNAILKLLHTPGHTMESMCIAILDVRKKSEYDSEHIVNAINAPLDAINESMLLIDKNKTYYVHCAGGYRSMIFASILKARGYTNLIDVDGGFGAIKESGKFKMTEYLCPTTLL